ncbi:MAG TPA: amidohydrolase family protein [Gemmatimonadaceae bacterium]|nr:amidohydrolase family protein [Gemmatimonadaceae bacterium]
MRNVGLLLAVAATACSGSRGPEIAPYAAIAITHVTVVDVRGGSPRTDATVVVRGNRIASIGSSDSVAPADARIVDGRGKYLIPGLWDMHVHAAWPNIADPVAELFVANGVTGVRDMWGDPDIIRDWKRHVTERDGRYPRLVAAGNLVDGPDPVWPNSIRVRNANDARNVVRSLQREGAEFIKVYSHLPRDAYFAIAEESRKLGIPFAGHVTIAITAAEASQAGQRSIEHLTGVALGCSALESQIVDETSKTIDGRGWATASAFERAAGGLIDSTYDAARCDSLAALFVRNQTWQVPTLTVRYNVTHLDEPALENDARLRYVPRFVKQRWFDRAETIERGSTRAALAQKAQFQREVMIVGQLWRDGVPILAGTDELNPYCLPGFSLHDELARLVGAGLTPLAALQAATINPARFLSAADSLGTVEPGKVADLVLLDGDPLADIRNVSRILAVVANGRLIDAADRERLLNDAAGASGPMQQRRPVQTGIPRRRP